MLKFIVTLLFAQVLLAAPLPIPDTADAFESPTAVAVTHTVAGTGAAIAVGGLAEHAVLPLVPGTEPIVGVAGGLPAATAGGMVAMIPLNEKVSEHMANTPGLGLEGVCVMNCVSG